MRDRLLRFVLPLLLVSFASTQQRRALQHGDYDSWNSLRGVAYSQDGAWVAYQVQPGWGDGVLIVRQVDGDRRYERPRGSTARFSPDGRFVAFVVEPSKVDEREEKLEELRERARAIEAGEEPKKAKKKKDEDEGKPLFVLELATGDELELGDVKKWSLSNDVPLLLYHPVEKKKDEKKKRDEESGEEAGEGEEQKGEEQAAAEEKPAETKPAEAKAAETKAVAEKPAAEGKAAEPSPKKKAGKGKKKDDPLAKKRPDGKLLHILDLDSGENRKVEDVVAYGFSRKARWLWLHTSAKEPKPDGEYGLFVEEVDGGARTWLLRGIANVGDVSIDRDETAIAFLSDLEQFGDKHAAKDLYLFEEGDDAARRVAYAGAAGMTPGMRVAGSVGFSRDGAVLSFALQEDPEPEPLPILPEDKVVLDIWNHRDGLLQTMQAKRTRKENVTAAFWRADERLVVLGDERTPSLSFVGTDGARMLGSDGSAYEHEISWDGRYGDAWLVDARTGTRRKVVEKLRGRVRSSPGGQYVIWFGDDDHWWTMHCETGVRRDLTANIPVPFHQHDDDHPAPAGSYGVAGWTEGDREVLLYDEFDVWRVSPASGEAACVTDGFGRKNGIELRLRQLRREDDPPFVQGELLLAAQNVETMASGYYVDTLDGDALPRELVMLDRSIGRITRPEKTDRLFFTLSTFREYPDLWTADARFGDRRRLTDANPQQQEYRWGDAELVHWVDGDGERRKGILIKPDGFDPQKQYPMMVYFYEKMSDRLHSYVAPAAGTSPNASYYVSNGYLWFMPDIVYEVGYPGPSCVKCVVSGVQHLISKGFVDDDAIGAAGHSWGGYQTAFLVTRTNIFKCVESGAPVSNMLSAYGGIRYGTGMSRQFQYEMTQSRIGGTPWQYPLRYQENSPIWFADKVQTPVLMIHNDHDGAVPWTQGIEYFVALRRLGKEAYLFNYNGEDHGLRKRQNQRDWTRRMQEYFDHHLKGAPAPAWMTDGVAFRDRDAEKLPFAPSYIDAHVNAPRRPAEEPSEASAEGAAEGAAEQGAAAEGAAEPVEEAAGAAEASGAAAGERKRSVVR